MLKSWSVEAMAAIAILAASWIGACTGSKTDSPRPDAGRTTTGDAGPGSRTDATGAAGAAGAMSVDTVVPTMPRDLGAPVRSACQPQPEIRVSADGAGSDPLQLCGRPAYAGSASDEALITIVDAQMRLKPDPSLAAELTVPAEQEVFRASDGAPDFAWSSPIAQRMRCDDTARYADSGAPSVWDRLSSLFVSKAYAHCPPITGALYFLKFTIEGEPCVHSVLTTEEHWQVDDAMWATMIAAGGKPIRLSILSVYLTDNRVMEGPYMPSSERTFRVMP